MYTKDYFRTVKLLESVFDTVAYISGKSNLRLYLHVHICSLLHDVVEEPASSLLIDLSIGIVIDHIEGYQATL